MLEWAPGASLKTGDLHCAVVVSDEYELSRFQLVTSAKASWI